MDRPPLKSVRLLDRLRERLRYAHYSLRTEKTYVYWARFFVRFHRMRHPTDMGSAEVESFFSFLANERHVSPSTHRQALAAILNLYKEVLGIELPWMTQIGRPKHRLRIPVVLSREEVSVLLAAMEPPEQLIAQLLYGCGLRILECLRLRIKDIDSARKVIVIREGKGSKDRVVMLPDAVAATLHEQIAESRALWAAIAHRNWPESGCQMRWSRSFGGAANRGPGTGYFPRRVRRLILARMCSDGITSTSNASAAP